MTEVIYQPTRYSCMACVAAMILGETIQEVFDALGHDGDERHYHFCEIARFLAGRGVVLGMSGPGGPGVVKIERDHPALVIVAGKGKFGTHAVYWDGSDFLDPIKENTWRTIFDYDIKEWWPITYFKDYGNGSYQG